jgi:hypothetical protein
MTSESVRVRAGAAARAPERLKWAGAGRALGDLGLDSAEPLFEPSTALSPRLERLEQSASRTRWRFPLPGTSDARGNLTGRPGPLGTGWLWLTVFRGRLGELLRARCTHPRSASLAEREWNLLCWLRAHGVGTPEPLLVGARGSGFVAGRSFLLVRAPEDAFPLPRWLRTDGIGAERERGLVALGAALARLVRARVELPRLAAGDLWLTPGQGCEAGEPGPPKNRLPGVSIVAVRGGRLRRGADPAAQRPRLERMLTGEELALTAEERRRVLAQALGG